MLPRCDTEGGSRMNGSPGRRIVLGNATSNPFPRPTLRAVWRPLLWASVRAYQIKPKLVSSNLRHAVVRLWTRMTWIVMCQSQQRQLTMMPNSIFLSFRITDSGPSSFTSFLSLRSRTESVSNRPCFLSLIQAQGMSPVRVPPQRPPYPALQQA